MAHDGGWPVTGSGEDNVVEIDDSVTRAGQVTLTVNGHRNRIRVAPGVRLAHCVIEIRGSDCTLDIGERCVISGQLRLRAHDTHLSVGAETTIMGAQITLHEAGTIRLGVDCMLSGNILMDVSDMHSILDVDSGQRINPPADIDIGDHVWLANGVQLLKGATIGAHCVIGARAVVSGAIPARSLAAGVPARVLRSGVTWDRRRLPWGEETQPPLANAET